MTYPQIYSCHVSGRNVQFVDIKRQNLSKFCKKLS